MTNDELYKIAIEGRKTHLETYHFWMNMYAIINGTLFVGLYTVINNGKSDFISFSIMLLGCLAGWFWHLSVRGFHVWIISWIKNVQRFENKEGVYKTFCNVKSNKKIKPLSTPKLTKGFTLGVAILWSILTLYQFCSLNSIFSYISNEIKCIIKFFLTSVLILLLAFFIIINACKCSRESDLNDTNDVISCDKK